MAGNLKVCDLDPDLKEKLRKFRFRKEKTNAGIVLKVDTKKLTVVEDEEYQDHSLEEIAEELPSSQPRFLVYSYAYSHGDGRISYPLCFISVSPAGCKPEQQMMYSGTQTSLVSELEITKTFEVRNIEELNEEWLIEKLKFFR